MLPRPGDIILYQVDPQSSWASKVVAVGELLFGLGRGAEAYSHCAILDYDPAYQLEAYWPKTRRSRIPHDRLYEVWRLHGETPSSRNRGIMWCYLHLHEWYNMLGLLFGWLRIHFHARYCSEFVRASKEAAGHHMPADQDGYFSPNQLADYCKKHGTLILTNKGK